MYLHAAGEMVALLVLLWGEIHIMLCEEYSRTWG